MRIVHEKHPRFLFAENVKNLVGHDGGKTFKVILEALQVEGYKYRYQVLNAMEYGNVPQNRERIYIVAFRDEEDYQRFAFPDPVPLKKKLADIIDFENKLPEKYYYTAGKYKGDIYDQLVAAMLLPVGSVTARLRSHALPVYEADSRLYKQAGNSVCVSVINRIAENMMQAMDPPED